MSFMKLYTEQFAAYMVETRAGDCVVPIDVVGLSDDDAEILERLTDYVQGEPLSFEIVDGWFARYSAPGYLDCTEWCGPFTSENEAIKACKDLYGDDDDSDVTPTGDTGF